ncbi:MAG: hypothetical protein ACK5L3_09055 [Oscillospiraceae bacterium]
MRQFNTADVFVALRAINDIGLKEELKGVMKEYEKNKKDTTATQLGVDAALQIFAAVSAKKAEQKLYEFLAGPFECTPAEVGEIPLDDLIGQMAQLGGKNVKGFFTSVYKLLIRK